MIKNLREFAQDHSNKIVPGNTEQLNRIFLISNFFSITKYSNINRKVLYNIFSQMVY